MPPSIPSPLKKGGGGRFFKSKLVTMSKKGGHMKDSLKTRRPARASVSASTDTGVPIALSADHPGFERPTSRTKSERPNHWAVLAYLLKNKIF